MVTQRKISVSDLKTPGGESLQKIKVSKQLKKIIDTLDALDYLVVCRGSTELANAAGLSKHRIGDLSKDDRLTEYRYSISSNDIVWGNKKTIADLTEGENG